MTSSTDNAPAPASGPLRWMRSIGPGLVTACVVIGPGSILTSSKVGATHGYAMSWVVIIAVLFMMIYMMLGAKLGVTTGRSAGDLVTERAGRPLAILIGMGVFFISAAYQFGNNLGVHAAFDTYRPMVQARLGDTLGTETIDGVFMWVLVPVFNLVAISFMFAFRNLYRALERLMATFVGLMLIAFAINLLLARPDFGDLLGGFVPRTKSPSGAPIIDLSLLGLVGTTFVITAAYYQSYLVRFKGWGEKELRNGLIDARVGSAVMALITLMIMSNAAAAFHGSITGDELGGVGDVAAQLESAFGEKGRVLFCLGLFSAAYSSFLVNSMIGGFILSDGLGLGNTPQQLWPRLMTVVVLLTGMGVALYVIKSGEKPVAAIVAAQAVTVLAAPLLAGALWWLTSRRDLMGGNVNGPLLNAVAGAGFVLLLAMAYRLAVYSVWPEVEAVLFKR